MSKEELIKFLKENLRIGVKNVGSQYEDDEYLVVELYVGGECISIATTQ